MHLPELCSEILHSPKGAIMPRLYFEESPVIAAVKTAEELKSALSSDVEIVFLLHATLSNLGRRMELAREAGK